MFNVKFLSIYGDEREKIFRLVQYATRLMLALQEKRDNNEEAVEKLKQIESMIVFSRQTLRFGKFIDYFDSALKSMHTQANLFRILLTLSRISYGLYLFCDNLIWLSKIGIIKSDQKRLAEFASSFLLYYSILTMSKNFYFLKKTHNYATLCGREAKTLDILIRNKSTLLSIINNFCDILISLDSLNKIRLSSFKIGILGMYSSLFFILQRMYIN